MSKYQLEDLLNEITGTGRIGTYIDTYRGLVNKIDDLKEKGVRVKELGMSGDGKTAFEFEIYPGDKDEAFSVYPYKFDPRDEDDMEIFRFSIGGKPVAIRAAKELLGDGAYSNAEIRDGLDQLDDAGDDTSDFSDLREANEDYDLLKIKKEIRFHLDTYEKGIIDGDDLAQAVEEVVFGEIKAPGMNSDDDFEREQRMQMSMREEDTIEEGGGGAAMLGPFQFLRSKGIDDDIIKDFMKVHAKDIVGASEDEIMDEFENFRSVNYDYVDEDLKEHFGRFMKDYQ